MAQRAERRLEAEGGYGLEVHDGLGVLTPYGAVTLATTQRYRLGWRLELGPDFDLTLESERYAAMTGRPEYGLKLEMRLWF